MKIKFKVDDIYPAYEPIAEKLTTHERKCGKPTLEVNEATFKKWKKICNAYRELQAELYQKLDGNTN